ncbi:MAG: substrate-binding domain-containing protein [Verrucomicrobiae bacterium]|nr:substrate-binding domain-containing protein [Verrucomicrobiae bacterium]
MKNPLKQIGFLSGRKSLVEQAADALCAALQKGVWTGMLPAERLLCRMLGVSRPVLRRAIHRVEEKGWVRVSRGHPARILRSPCGAGEVAGQKQVVMLQRRPVRDSSPWALMIRDEIRRELAVRGCRLEQVVDLRLNRKRPQTVLRQLELQHQPARWLLLSLPFSAQRWFQEQKKPAVVMGHVFPGIELPSVDYDWRAVARHAAGMFLGLGHLRAVFLTRSGAAGELAAAEGFEEAFRQAPKTTFHIIRHSGDVDEIRLYLKSLFIPVSRPTAVLVSHAMDVLVVRDYLNEAGWRVPGDVSLMTMGEENFLERIRPTLARYEVDSLKLARAACRLLERPDEKRRTIRLIARFRRGETLGSPGKDF